MPLPHGPIVELAKDLWAVRGELRRPKALGRRMVLVRDPAGGIFVHNAIFLGDDGWRALDALGRVRTIFVPNRFHDMDGGRMADRYPDARLVALPAVREKLLGKFPALGVVDEASLPPHATLRPVPGLRGDESVLEVRTGDTVTQVYTDAFFNVPHGSGFEGFVLRAIGSSGGFFMTKVGKLLLLASRDAFRAYVEAQRARTDITRVIVSHGDVVDGGERVREAFGEALRRL
jgi:hypothetical protein